MSQFLEVIEWFDNTGNVMAQRIPPEGSGEIKMGAQCIVRENQCCIFFRDGKSLDMLGPGRHVLSTMNLPILTKLLALPYGFKSPFRAEVVFVNLKVFQALGWGTREPIIYRDAEFGLVRLQGRGRFTVRVKDPLVFVNTLVGTAGTYTTDDCKEYMRSAILNRMLDLLGENLKSIVDLASMYNELSAAAKVTFADDFSKYGIELMDFFIEAISVPEEVQKMIDQRSAMGAMGKVNNQEMNQYMKYKAMTALGDAAQQPGGGVAGPAMAGIGMGAGLGVGMVIPQMMQGQQSSTAPQEAKILCPKCNTPNIQGAKFCTNCGSPIIVSVKCPHCQADAPAGAKFCPNCGKEIGAAPKCPQCQGDVMPGAKFCPNCGAKLG